MNSLHIIDVPHGEAAEASWRELVCELAEESRVHRFRVAPNPNVGAAVLSQGKVIARGYHEEFGGPHAEIQALAAARESEVPSERWDTLVITLEPCSSRGKTPPCTEAILAAGIQRVVVAGIDPDPRHGGKGLELLREAGVDVVVLEGAPKLAEISPHFERWSDPDRLRRPRPWTIAKWAQTRTGQLSPPEDVGEGRWISGPESLAEVQRWRGRVDAIVTGIGTVLADDPRLSVRKPGDLSRPPLRVVLDTELRTPPDAKLLTITGDGESEAAGEVHVLARAGASATRHRALVKAGAQVHSLRPAGDGHVSLRAVNEWLWDQGVRRVLLETGPTLLEALFKAEMIDQVAVYSGNINGGRGPSLAVWLELRRLAEVDHQEVGADAKLEAFVVH